MNDMNNFVHFARANRAIVFVPALGMTAEFDDFRNAVKFAVGMYRKYARVKNYTVSRSISVYYNGKLYDNDMMRDIRWGKRSGFDSHDAESSSLEYAFRFERWCFAFCDMSAKECISNARRNLTK